MPAPKGNKFAQGHTGGYGMPKEYREKQVELRKKIVDEMLKVMNGKNKNAKLQLVMKLGLNCVPREVELNNGGDGEFILKIVDYGSQESRRKIDVPTPVAPEAKDQGGEAVP